MMRRRALVSRWCLLIVASAILAAILEQLAVPAALLLGPMIAAIAVVTIVGKIPFPRWPVRISQAVIGCLIAHNITGDTLATVLADWPIFAVCVVSVIASSSVIGWLLARFGILPGTTAVWGSAPGGASTMSLMAEAYGADFRLVAVMQYMRVVMVALTTSLITSFLAAPIKTVATINWFPPITWNTAATILIVAVGLGLGKLSRLPGGPLLVPLAAGSVLQATGIVALDLPPWLLAASYTIIGCSIGSAFTREILRYAARALPKIIATSLCLIVVCSGIAVILSLLTGLDFLTSYLATSPGGADTVAIIAASTHIDAPFVMAMQVARLLTILLVGPSIARLVAKLAERSAPK
jgi:uncharacterized protein